MLLLLICAVGSSTHNRAGQIVFRHISGYTYEITLITLTYSLSAADRPRMNISWGDGTTSEVNRSPFNRRECEVLPGFYQKNIYTTTHTFPGPGVYTILAEDPNRNEGVENIPNSVAVIFAVKTIFRIDLNFGHNNAPELRNYPTDKAAVGRRFVHNPSAYDIDGDSLSYELAVCLRERGVEIETYRLPEYHEGGELYVDAVTGDFVWDAPVKAGIYNVAMRINEWRNGVKINSITRDMQIDVVETDNEPPKLEIPKDTCVVAGALVKVPIKATDQNDDKITLTATGLPFDVTISPAEISIDEEGDGYTYATFTWQTDVSHARNQPYTVVFKAEDQNSDVKLVTFASYNITVIAPEVENLSATPEKKSILLEWEPSICSHASGYEIFRRICMEHTPEQCKEFELEPCETGVPAGYDYIRIATVNGHGATMYNDNNNGMQLSPGVNYCYRVVAIFDDGAKSLPSKPDICEIVEAGTPPIILAHVEKIDDRDGEIHIEWLEKTFINDLLNTPQNYEYHLFYSFDQEVIRDDDPALWTPLGVFNLYAAGGDTTFIHKSIDTKNNFPYYYKVVLIDKNTGNPVEELTEYEIASTLYPVLSPSDKSVNITFGRYAPWVNTQYDIYHYITTATGVETVLAGRTDRETYRDINLVNEQEYCYLIVSSGYRNIDGIYRNENRSHVACVTPFDNVTPCTPEISGVTNCEEHRNELQWEYTFNCQDNEADDLEKFIVYFSREETIEYDAFEEIATVYRDDVNRIGSIYYFFHTGRMNGAYFVIAVDYAGNESEPSNIVWLFDLCGISDADYEIPNVFTPNNDGINDYLVARIAGGCYCLEDGTTICRGDSEIVSRIDIQIINRIGKLVFRTSEPCINWDGRDIDNGHIVPTGVYYYTCQLYKFRVGGIEEVVDTLSGFIHVYSEPERSTEGN